MIEWLTEALVEFVAAYGYAALFVFIVLETAFILHFAPSEVVIPVAAAHVVSGPVEFAAFVGVATVGAVIGSHLAYHLFGVNGETVARKYGHVLRIPESEIERSQAWFRRHGEPLMFWGRLIPVVRTPISIPAGFAGMDRRRFTLYSAGGWLVYNTVLVWLVYEGGAERAPIDVAAAIAADLLGTYPWLSSLLGVALVGGAAWYVLVRGEASERWRPI